VLGDAAAPDWWSGPDGEVRNGAVPDLFFIRLRVFAATLKQAPAGGVEGVKDIILHGSPSKS